MAKMKNPSILDILFTPHLTDAQFSFQALWAPPLYSMLTFDDVAQLKAIATSIKYNANINKKYELIDQIMRKRGFRKFAGGTNRIVYACEENSNILLKIAIDRVGIGDNPAEYINQWLLQPYVCKCFEVSACGTIGVFERLIPITHIEEFVNIANDVFDIIVYKWLGKYVLDDIGTKYFMNWAIRKGFGPCLIDFPYMYKLDSNKLYCNKELQFGTGVFCGGEIDYNAGFNDLVCTRCGKVYIAKQLEDNTLENNVIIKGGNGTMKIGYYNEEGKLCIPGNSSDYISTDDPKLIRNTSNEIRVALVEVPVKRELTDVNPFDTIFNKPSTNERFNIADTSDRVEEEKEEVEDIKTNSSHDERFNMVNDKFKEFIINSTEDEEKEVVPEDFNGEDEEVVIPEPEKEVETKDTIVSDESTIHHDEKPDDEEYVIDTVFPSVHSKFISNKHNKESSGDRDSRGRFKKKFDDDEDDDFKSGKGKKKSPSKLDKF